jgi:hypothetical protein
VCVRQLGMACACLCALAGDDVSRRALLHLPATTPAMVALLTAVLPTPTQPTSPAALTAPAMSVLLALSQDLFSQVRRSLLSLYADWLPRRCVRANGGWSADSVSYLPSGSGKPPGWVGSVVGLVVGLYGRTPVRG